ncbi:MAG: hypothetical protein J6C96_05540 [Oscillospiraceae bacterium]|nr:hypothetical protein [Oscillospiraceae bacterium]
MSTEKELKAIELLKAKYNELGRLPKKTEFVGTELTFVKSILGPLPRAFEAAGLKEVSPMYLEKLKRRGGKKRRRHHYKIKEKKNA